LETFNKTPRTIFIGLIIFTIGVILSILRGPHFSDGDAYSIINSYLIFIETGSYSPSRGAYGHPIPEFLLGFTAYNFGIIASNILSFLFFYLSIIFISISFVKKEKLLFFILVFSNSILLIDNTNTIDYPLALFFFSIGFYFLRQSILISSVFFSFCIASRASFSLFIYPVILIYFFSKYSKNNKSIINIFKSLTIITIIGILFYIPVFIVNDFSLSFIKIPFITNNTSPGWYGGPEFSLISLIPRFFYKVYQSIGIFSSLVIAYLVLANILKIKLINKINLIIFFIVSLNLIIFFFMPTKYLILNPFLIFLYIFLTNTINKKIIKILIFCNILQWIISYNLIDIKYKNNNFCEAKHAISAKYTFKIEAGYLYKFFESLNTSSCYEKYLGKYSQNYINNIPLKLSK